MSVQVSVNSNIDASDNTGVDLLMLEQLLSSEDDKKCGGTGSKVALLLDEVPRLQEDSNIAENAAILRTEAKYLDSSDDEDVKNFLERKYDEYGSEINKILKQERSVSQEQRVEWEVNMSLMQNQCSNDFVANNSISKAKESKSRCFTKKVSPLSGEPSITTPQLTPKCGAATTFTDPVFGLRIINPLVSSSLLVERMSGRKAVPFSQVAFHTQRGNLSKDWVIAGVLVSKSPVRTSKKGQLYSLWRLSDLRGVVQIVSLFLFKGAHEKLWKTALGMCLAVLNPTVFEKRTESGEVACLSIDTAQKVMVLGQSKDLGTCKAKKRSGEPCTATVNLSECDYCVFHMKQEYNKMSRRSELQSATTGRGLTELRNKVLGKSEVFYSGQSFTAIPARKSSKLMAKDLKRMDSLSEYAVLPYSSSIKRDGELTSATQIVPYASRDGHISKIASNMEINTKQRFKDLERLKSLQVESMPNPLVVEDQTSTKSFPQFSKTAAITPLQNAVPSKFRNKEFSFECPKLSRETFSIEVNISESRRQLARLKAAKILKQSPIEKSNPNSIRGTSEGKRRAIDELNEHFVLLNAKRQKLEESHREIEHKSRIQRIIEASSSHMNLVDLREQEEQEKYFAKQQKKEALEEKMLTTYKMPCKAVICKKCKYTAFSAAECCKKEKHPLKVIDAEKRFFQCKDCGNRTITVYKFPKMSCKNCKSSRWERTAMIRERIITDGTEGLSVRGDEECFIGTLTSKANINLLVPEE